MRSPAEPSRLTAAVAHARRRLVVWCPDWPVRAVASSGIPVGESQAGKGSLPHGHPQLLGAIGSTGTTAANAIARDAELLTLGKIKSVGYQFYVSKKSGTVGADPRVLELLRQSGIPYEIHPPS